MYDHYYAYYFDELDEMEMEMEEDEYYEWWYY